MRQLLERLELLAEASRGFPIKGYEKDAEIKFDGKNLSIKIPVFKTFDIKGKKETYRISGSHLRGSVHNGKLEMTSIAVSDDETRSLTSLAMIGMALKALKPKGIPFTTSGVFSPQGKKLMQLLVRRGQAKPIDGGQNFIVTGD